MDESLDSIIEDKQKRQPVTRYRRRDLRNGLAQRMGIEERPIRDYEPRDVKRGARENSRPPAPPKKRLRILNIPLDASDYVIEDMIKELGATVYQNIYDHEDDRTAVFEFEDPKLMDEAVEKLNGKVLNGNVLSVEIFESQRRPERHYQRGPRSQQTHGHQVRPKGSRGPKREAVGKPTIDQLDAELDAYMKE